MIHYQLRCGAAHEFDAWFRDSAAYEEQARRGLLECPHCGERQVARALMAPALPRKGGPAARRPAAALADTGTDAVADADPAPATPTPSPAAVATRPGRMLPDHVRAALQRLRGEVERRCEYVGDRFADEARRIHDGDSRHRGIYGEASPEQAEALAEDGIEVTQIPWLKRADA